MKITKAFFTIFSILLSLASCGNDDDSFNSNNDTKFLNFNNSANSEPDNNSDFFLNLQQTGNSANELLSANSHTSVILELIYTDSFKANEESIDNLVNFIKKRTFKPNGINIVKRSIPPINKQTVTINQIDSLERVNRTQFSTPSQHAVFIYFSNADAQSDDGSKSEGTVLGSAYRNTSIVIYSNTLSNIIAKASERSNNSKEELLNRLETFTLQHEYSHLLGLVNLGTPLQSQHENQKNNGHCNVDGCLMEANVNLQTLLNSDLMMGDTQFLELDPLCIQDLQANGGK